VGGSAGVLPRTHRGTRSRARAKDRARARGETTRGWTSMIVSRRCRGDAGLAVSITPLARMGGMGGMPQRMPCRWAGTEEWARGHGGTRADER
jgi:hypothetical protein